MAGQESCGKNILDMEEARRVTFGELLDMRAELNARLEDQIGRPPESGFDIQLGSTYEDRISFCLAYVKIDGDHDAVVSSFETFKTPQAAFEFAAQRIEELKLPTKQDKIDRLKKQLEELENE